MDDRTVIAKPTARLAKGGSQHSPVKPVGNKSTFPDKQGVAKTSKKNDHLSRGIWSLVLLALLLVGFSTALLTVYMLSPDIQSADYSGNEFSATELETQIVAVSDDTTTDNDVALIKSVTEPKIIDLSGDPIIVKQLQGKARQLLRIDTEPAISAARNLGAKGPVFRMTDMLDSVNTGVAQGVLGAQEDFAFFQNTAFRPASTTQQNTTSDSVSSEDLEGTSLVYAQSIAASRIRSEFATQIKKPALITDVLLEFGLEPSTSRTSSDSFEKLYGVKSLDAGDSIAVLAAVSSPGSTYSPMQITLYRSGEWLATVAMNDLGQYVKGEDPWHNQDIFAAQLLPDSATPGKEQRLLDAIYGVAVKNGLSAAVAGETIMLLSRAYDLEQPVLPGDNISILYSPDARDPRTGFGRVLFVGIDRSSVDISCYVFQPNRGSQFECMTSDGESGLAEAGMVMPVNGTVVAKFGPQDQTSDGSSNMNYGVDWAAPKGSPVVAAFAGEVTFASSEKELGNIIRVAHADGSETTYAYLQRFASGIAVGSKVAAGETIGFVGSPPFSREPRLHFELRRNGEPIDPIGEMQSSIGKGGVIDIFVQRIIYIESANRCNARNPLSTAVGLGQFIESTWMTTIRLHRPDLLVGRSRADVLALRTNCELARAMTAAFTRDNAAVIRNRGHQVTPGNLYLAHFLGVGGAIKALSSHPGRSVAEVFGASHVRANPFLQGKTISYLTSWAAKKMTGKTPKTIIASKEDHSAAGLKSAKTQTKAPKAVAASEESQRSSSSASGTESGPNSGSVAEAKLVKYQGDTKFAELKRNVDLLLR